MSYIFCFIFFFVAFISWFCMMPIFLICSLTIFIFLINSRFNNIWANFRLFLLINIFIWNRLSEAYSLRVLLTLSVHPIQISVRIYTLSIQFFLNSNAIQITQRFVIILILLFPLIDIIRTRASKALSKIVLILTNMGILRIIVIIQNLKRR